MASGPGPLVPAMRERQVSIFGEMKSRATIVVLLFLIGSAVMGVALFAESLGVDPNAGWGPRRIALVTTGFCILLGGAAYWRYGDEVPGITRRLWPSLEHRIPALADRVAPRAVRLRALCRDYWYAVPLVLFIVAVYVWFVSTGSWTNWVSPTHYYADLARGFARGKLYVAVRPDPNLLTATNPWEPLPNGGTAGLLDLSYYRGRFYLYWGPVPAVLLLLVRPIINWRVGDLQLAFAFSAGVCILQCLFAVLVWDRWFKALPKYLLWTSILVMGLANPVTFVLNNHQGARIYEASIMGGQFFLVSGFLTALAALGPPTSRGRLMLAGGLWALALGTRLNLALPAGVLALLVTAWILKFNEGSGRKLSQVIALCAPLALGLVCVSWYNWARFGSVTETGWSYQMAGNINMHDHYGELFGPSYMLQNLFNYPLNPVDIRAEFPFLHVLAVTTKPILPFYPLPELYGGQQTTGMLYTVPFIVFAIIAVVNAFRTIAGKRGTQAGRLDHGRQLWNWIVLSLSAASLASFGFLLPFYWCAMRYLEDFLPLLIALSVMGFWQGYQELSHRRGPRRWYAGLGVILAGASIISSTLVALSINDARFAIIRLLSSTR